MRVGGRSALLLASKLRRPQFVRLIVEMRPDADVNVLDVHVEGEYAGYTPLAYACHFGIENAVLALLSRTDLKVNQQCDGKGHTALMLAAMRGHDAIVDLLIQRPDLEVNKATKKAFHTALMFAALRKHRKVVEVLVGHPDIAVNSKDCNMVSVFQMAQGDPGVCRMMLDRPELDVMYTYVRNGQY